MAAETLFTGRPMFPKLRTLVVVAAIGLAGGSAHATGGGWMGFRNDTGSTLVIQETVASRQGRPQKIFANETVRDTPGGSGPRAFAIYDADRPSKPLYSGQFPAPQAGENVLYVIKSDGKGGLTIDAVKSPAAAGLLKKLPGKR